jgi:hypothetical protein
MAKAAVFGSVIATVTLVASCSGGTSAPKSAGSSSSPTSAAASSSAAPTTFTSAKYGYTLTVPANWIPVQAGSKWDGHTGLSIDSGQVDEFFSDVEGKGSFGVAARWTRDLAAYTRWLVSWTQLTHGETCPPKPDTRTPVTIGGQPGVLLAYNCGILINIAATVHHGVAYQFVFRDGGVPAASDPGDHAAFLQILRSVQLPR